MRFLSLSLVFLLFLGCSGLEQSEKEKLRQANAKGEYILRNHDELFYLIAPPKHRLRDQYPWEKNYVGNFPKITKEFFRCKGKSTNSEKFVINNLNEQLPLFDCGGGSQHSLPIRDGQEFIYPVLIDILNYIQSRTFKKVMITSGHRCPAHNAYAEPKSESSKHMLGAEVDFYVAGLENNPEAIIELIFRFYKENARYRGIGEYELFSRYEKGDTDVSTPPWHNKEIFIKLYKRGEGRDGDNQHPYPYISIQVLRDRDTKQRVSFSWAQANKGYHRY